MTVKAKEQIKVSDAVRYYDTWLQETVRGVVVREFISVKDGLRYLGVDSKEDPESERWYDTEARFTLIEKEQTK